MKRVGHPAMQSQFAKWLGESPKRWILIQWSIDKHKFRCQIFEGKSEVSIASESFAATPDGAFAGAVINGKFD